MAQPMGDGAEVDSRAEQMDGGAMMMECSSGATELISIESALGNQAWPM